MAQLNTYVNTLGETVAIPTQPSTRYSPNAIARITPKSARAAAKLAYKAWVDGGEIGLWDGVFNDGAPQDLLYTGEVVSNSLTLEAGGGVLLLENGDKLVLET